MTATTCDGHGLRRAFRAAAALLDARADELNALNVYPVPDGDTGTNMALTLQSALRAVEVVDEPTVPAVAQAASHGALLGARGNSGVITSQFLRGFAQAVARARAIGGRELADAFTLASATAYRAVVKPVEGTMLTVSRDIARSALARAEAGGDLTVVLEAAIHAARQSVARTPSLLPVLRQAGVVDAGGQGLLIVLEGFAQALIGLHVEMSTSGPLPLAALGTDREGVQGHRESTWTLRGSAAAARLDHDGCYGYCTEFLIRGEGLDADQVRERLAALGDSLLAVGEPKLVRVHIHTFNPGQVLDYAITLGSLHQIKIDNMQEQHRHVLAAAEPHPRTPSPSVPSAARERGPGGEATAEPDLSPLPAVPEPSPRPQGGWQLPLADTESAPGDEVRSPSPLTDPAQERWPGGEVVDPAVVVVASGEGFAEVFRGLGAAAIIPGGQSMNPSTEDLLRAVADVPAQRVILLPNNGNILLAAQQVRALTGKQVAVVPTHNLAEGVAALLALNYDADLSTNARLMERAARGLASAEMTRAVRAARIDDLQIQKSDVIGLIGNHVVSVGGDDRNVLADLLEKLGAGQREVVTLYRGADAELSEAKQLADHARVRYPALRVEVVDGGQPHYHFIVAVE